MNAPKPTALKLIQGNPGKRPLNENEPKPEKIIPRCPSHLNKLAKKHWKEVSKYLFKNGLLTEMDGDALAIYCQQWADWIQIEDHLKPEKKEDGTIEFKDMQIKMTMDTDGKVYYEGRSNPRIKHKYELMKMMKGYLAEFGMTPSSRSRIGIQPIGGKEGIKKFLT
jgi:P27 family predicted phage terminase small subunit